MNPTPDSVSSASNWQIFKSWVKHKLRSAFTWNRKTRMLEDPAVLLQEAKARGDNPYAGLSRRKIKLNENPQSQVNRAALQSKDDFSRIGIEVSSLPEHTDLFIEFQSKLLSQAKSLQYKIYKQGTFKEMQTCSRLVNETLAKNWPVVLKDLTLALPAEELHELTDFIRPLQFLLNPPQEESSNSQMETGVRITADKLLGKEIFLMSGDISRMNESRTPPIQAIACPYTPKGSKNETALLNQLSSIDPGLARKGFLESIKKMKPGLAAISPSPALQGKGFSHMVHAILPHSDSKNIHSELVSAYQSAIEAAHRKNLTSIAIPIFSSELNIPPQRAATIACVAISRYMSNHPHKTRPPKVYLVFPATEEGARIQQVATHYLQKTHQNQSDDSKKQYQAFRQQGLRVGNPVELVYKTSSPVPAKSKETESNDLEAILARVNRKLQTGPDKVEGIRELAKKAPPTFVDASTLLARKMYTCHSSDPMKNTEYRLLHSMSHPNIITLKDSKVETMDSPSGTKQLKITIFTEAGICSFDKLKKDPPMPPKDIKRLMQETVKAIQYLHKNRITHNDLKPANVVLMPDMSAKLIDFDSAIEFRSSNQSVELLETTLPYLAPELAPSAHKAHPHSFDQLRKGDYWSTGCILYELITGSQLAQPNGPIDETSPTWALDKVNAIPDTIYGWSPNAIQALKATLRNLLDLNPDQRSLTSLEAFIKST